MDRIFKELPIVFPFYDFLENQDRFRETVRNVNQYKLISPSNSLLPFQIEMPVSLPNPTKWSLVKLPNGSIPGEEIIITENLPKVKLYVFADKKQAVYFGDPMTVSGSEMVLNCGFYYSVIDFPNGQKYYSEIFFIPENSFDAPGYGSFIKVEFWNNKDVEPILYRDDFKQVMYIDSFISSFVPEIDEKVEKDGFDNEIPTFQKLMLRYKFVDTVPDFIKIALISLQMQDVVYLTINESRKGEVDRVIVSVQPHDTGALSDVDVTFEDDVLYKTACGSNKTASSVTTW